LSGETADTKFHCPDARPEYFQSYVVALMIRFHAGDKRKQENRRDKKKDGFIYIQ